MQGSAGVPDAREVPSGSRAHAGGLCLLWLSLGPFSHPGVPSPTQGSCLPSAVAKGRARSLIPALVPPSCRPHSLHTATPSASENSQGAAAGSPPTPACFRLSPPQCSGLLAGPGADSSSWFQPSQQHGAKKINCVHRRISPLETLC